MSVTNGGYHYFGAAKIFAPIGKVFTEGMGKLLVTQRQKQQWNVTGAVTTPPSKPQ